MQSGKLFFQRVQSLPGPADFGLAPAPVLNRELSSFNSGKRTGRLLGTRCLADAAPVIYTFNLFIKISWTMEFPASPMLLAGARGVLESNAEEDIPTEPPPACQSARFSPADEDQERPGRVVAPARQRTQARLGEPGLSRLTFCTEAQPLTA